MSTVRLVVSGTESGDVTQDWDFDGVKTVETTHGAEPELVMTIENKNYERLVSGAITPPVAYMQGLLKSTGDTGILLELLSTGALSFA